MNTCSSCEKNFRSMYFYKNKFYCFKCMDDLNTNIKSTSFIYN